MTVYELRKSGYKVRVLHLRKNDRIFKMAPEWAGFSYNERASPTGGRTVVEITTPDKRELRGEAICRPDENYNKKLGVEIALERAFAEEYINLNS